MSTNPREYTRITSVTSAHGQDIHTSCPCVTCVIDRNWVVQGDFFLDE